MIYLALFLSLIAAPVFAELTNVGAIKVINMQFTPQMKNKLVADLNKRGLMVRNIDEVKDILSGDLDDVDIKTFRMNAITTTDDIPQLQVVWAGAILSAVKGFVSALAVDAVVKTFKIAREVVNFNEIEKVKVRKQVARKQKQQTKAEPLKRDSDFDFTPKPSIKRDYTFEKPSFEIEHYSMPDTDLRMP